MTDSRPASHFQRLYQSSADPWGFTTSAYEQGKYRTTMAALGERRFVSGLEAGCSIGVLTRLLAARCDALLGVDIVEEPLAAAAKRCADYPGVSFQRMQMPGEWPAGSFDLMVFSEVLYFLSAADIQCCARRTLQTLLPGGVVLLVNWTGQGGDPNSGDAAPDRFIAAAGQRLRVAHQERHPDYRLEVLRAD